MAGPLGIKSTNFVEIVKSLTIKSSKIHKAGVFVHSFIAIIPTLLIPVSTLKAMAGQATTERVVRASTKPPSAWRALGGRSATQ